MKEPARIVSAAHAKNSAMGLPMKDAFLKRTGATMFDRWQCVYWQPAKFSIARYAESAVNGRVWGRCGHCATSWPAGCFRQALVAPFSGGPSGIGELPLWAVMHHVGWQDRGEQCRPDPHPFQGAPFTGRLFGDDIVALQQLDLVAGDRRPDEGDERKDAAHQGRKPERQGDERSFAAGRLLDRL